jgi:hypothetical protein
MDKFGNFYFAGGAGAGLPIPFMKAGASDVGGYILDENSTETEVQNFVQAHSVNFSAGFVLGIGGTWGDPSLIRTPELQDFSVETGLYTPQLGVSYTYGILIYDNGNSYPWIWQRLLNTVTPILGR